jgi:hypothetical protein
MPGHITCVQAKGDAVGEFKRLPTTEQLAVDWG